MIVAAAVRLPTKGELNSTVWNGQRVYPPYIIVSSPPPARHHTVMHVLYEHTQLVNSPADQGFLTDTGQYLDRYEAYIHAVKHGQLPANGGKAPPALYSEDLW